MRELLAILALVALFLFDPRTALQRPPAAQPVASAPAQQAPQRRPAPVHHAARAAAVRAATRI